MHSKFSHTNFDNLETLLLMSMSANPEYEESAKVHGPKNAFSRYMEGADINKLIGAPDRLPSRAHTFDISGDRVYSPEIDLLMHHPFEFIRAGLETITFFEGSMKWFLVEEVKKPKRFYSVGRADKWFVVHFRQIFVNGDQEYNKEIVPMDKKGRVLRYGIESWKINNVNHSTIQDQIILACSLIEDTYRPGTLLAECSCDSSIIFPIAYGAHNEFLALRDGPTNTPTGRKNPILHFVSKHIRGSAGEVSEYWRGVSEVNINGMSLRLNKCGEAA